MDDLWQKTLDELSPSLSRANFVTWLKPTELLKAENGLVVIGVPNLYAKNWLEKNLLGQIRQSLGKTIEVGEVSLVINEKVGQDLAELPLLQSSETEPVETTGKSRAKQSQPFSDKYSFTNFIVGNNNRLAFAAAQVIAEKPGETYNPLFIYGGVGLGKTHLLQAIGNEIWRRDNRQKILYTSCENFTSEFIQALQNKEIAAFKKKYRSVDVFLIDDIQFLANKEGTQEEFFHTFNILHQANRQIVITSDRVPKEITELEDRLTSRLGWGMIADIQPPNFETRVAILQAKAAGSNLDIPTEVFDYIATTITSNVRELEGSLTKLAIAAQVESQPITVEFAQLALKDLISRQQSQLTSKQIIRSVAQAFNIETADILGTKRLKEFVYPRQLAMYLLRTKLQLSFPQIGGLLGGRDHTTVMHSVEKINRLRKTDAQVEADLHQIAAGLVI